VASLGNPANGRKMLRTLRPNQIVQPRERVSPRTSRYRQSNSLSTWFSVGALTAPSTTDASSYERRMYRRIHTTYASSVRRL
jgi:hypothetical protein